MGKLQLTKSSKRRESSQADGHSGRSGRSESSFDDLEANLLSLQRTIGNDALAAMLPPPTKDRESNEEKHPNRFPSPGNGGQPMDYQTRSFMESRLGHDFGNVRIHKDAQAAELARDANAAAFTLGHDIVFGATQYAPETALGKKLLAHELTHVLQQSDAVASRHSDVLPTQDVCEREANLVAHGVVNGTYTPQAVTKIGTQAIQRQSVPGGGATPGSGQGIDLIFIIRAPTDEFTNDVTKYVKTVLKGQAYEEVDNLDDIFDSLAKLRPTRATNFWERLKDPATAKPATPGQKVRRIRIVAHGSTAGDVKMTPRGEQPRRWFSPEEVAKFAALPRSRDIVQDVMTPDTVVEFWGCNVGGSEKGSEAWARLFRSRFTATTETFNTGYNRYYRPAARREQGDTLPGQQGRWVRVTQSREVDVRDRVLQQHFRQWLLGRYNELVQNGDISPVQGEPAQVNYMRDLFDRSDGDIRHIQIQKHSDAAVVRPGDQQNWGALWTTHRHLNIWEKALEGKKP